MGLRFEIYFAKFLQDISKPSILKKKDADIGFD